MHVGPRSGPPSPLVAARDEAVRIAGARARLEALVDQAIHTQNPLVVEEAAQWATILLALRAPK